MLRISKYLCEVNFLSNREEMQIEVSIGSQDGIKMIWSSLQGLPSSSHALWATGDQFLGVERI